MVKITIFTTPTCGACKMLKNEIKESAFSEYIKFEEVNENNRKLLLEHKVSSVPAIFMEVGNRSQMIVGYRPINILDNLVTEMIKY